MQLIRDQGPVVRVLLVRDAEFWLDTVPRCPHGRKRAHIPVAQAFRTEACSCCGVDAVEAKTLTPGRGELQNPSVHLARKLPEYRRALPARDISLLMRRESFGKSFPNGVCGVRHPPFLGIWQVGHFSSRR